MPTPAEIAYREAMRALDGQAQDLENIRSHVGRALTAGGVAIAFFASQQPGRGDAFVFAAAAFGVIAVTTVLTYWPVTFTSDLDARDLVNTYVDVDPGCTGQFMMRELAVHAGDDYWANKKRLDRLHALQSLALVAFGVEALSLLYHLALE